MQNLQECHGWYFMGYINNRMVKGRISVQSDLVYFCQNTHRGSSCKEKFGYKSSWVNDSACAQMIVATKTDSQNFTLIKPPQINDKITYRNKYYKISLVFNDFLQLIDETGEKTRFIHKSKFKDLEKIRWEDIPD